jgi:hypothetical protein
MGKGEIDDENLYRNSDKGVRFPGDQAAPVGAMQDYVATKPARPLSAVDRCDRLGRKVVVSCLDRQGLLGRFRRFNGLFCPCPDLPAPEVVLSEVQGIETSK